MYDYVICICENVYTIGYVRGSHTTMIERNEMTEGRGGRGTNLFRMNLTMYDYVICICENIYTIGYVRGSHTTMIERNEMTEGRGGRGIAILWNEFIQCNLYFMVN